MNISFSKESLQFLLIQVLLPLFVVPYLSIGLFSGLDLFTGEEAYFVAFAIDKPGDIAECTDSHFFQGHLAACIRYFVKRRI
jgi:hypothetical protein